MAIEAYINEEKTIKVLIRLAVKTAIRPINPRMPIISTRISFRLHPLRRRLLQPLHTQPLEGSKSPRARLNRIRRRNKITRRIRHIRRRIGILERLLARVDGPSGNVDLLSFGHIERFEEGVHVFPAVELAQATEFSLRDGFEGIASAVTVDELLDVCGLDLAAVVDDFACGVD